MTPSRDRAISEFLETAGWADAAVGPLAGDASRRRYLRLTRPDGTGAVLMDAPPHPETRTAAFVALSEWLTGLGYSAPRLIATDLDAGLLLIEDLGDALYARAVAADPSLERPLYEAAVDLLARLGAVPVPPVLGTTAPVQPRAYDIQEHGREARLLADWYLPAATGVATAKELGEEFDALVAETIIPAATADCIVLRDYHAENLLWLPDRAGLARVGLIDYQDALAGHPAYDLMSLLEDARRDTSDDLQQAMIARFLAARPDLDADAFRADYARLGAIRNMKILGIFARLSARDRKPRYVDLMPRVWNHLQRDLAHPALASLSRWTARHVPPPDDTVRTRIAAMAEERVA